MKPDDALSKVVVSLEDIERLREMRQLQKRFFQDRDKTVIGRAKWLEKKIDEWLDTLPKAEEDGLFAEE